MSKVVVPRLCFEGKLEASFRTRFTLDAAL